MTVKDCSESDMMTLPDTDHTVIKLGRSDRVLLMNLHLHHEQQHNFSTHNWLNEQRGDEDINS